MQLYSEQGDFLSQFSAYASALAVDSERDRVFIYNGDQARQLRAYTLSAPHQTVSEWVSAARVVSMDTAADGSLWAGCVSDSGTLQAVRWNTTTGSVIQQFTTPSYAMVSRGGGGGLCTHIHAMHTKLQWHALLSAAHISCFSPCSALPCPQQQEIYSTRTGKSTSATEVLCSVTWRHHVAQLCGHVTAPLSERHC